MNIGRNDNCPCGSGSKYKRCCLGEVDWKNIKEGSSDHLDNLSIRGRNLTFFEHVFSILDLEIKNDRYKWADIKRKVDPKAVRDIHESIFYFWPSFSNYESALQKEEKELSALYVGSYHPKSILNGIKRYSLYCDTIYIVDPFIYPTSVKPEFSPAANPDKFISDTLSCLQIWFSLFNWIQDGIVKIIRTPGDFIPGLNISCIRAGQKRRDENAELKSILKSMKPDDIVGHDEFQEYIMLMYPDEALVRMVKSARPDISKEEFEKFMDYVKRRKESHPYFVPNELNTNSSGEFHIVRSGASLDMAKVISDITGSHLVTDIPYKWKEIEIEREKIKSMDEIWSPFSKAFSNIKIKCLENVDLDFARKLRKENRLEDLRMFLRKIWLTSKTAAPFSEQNVHTLVAELDSKVREAQFEWQKIDQELVKWFSVGGVGAYAAGALSGNAELSWIGPILSGGVSLITSKLQRKAYTNRFPAGLFLKT